MDSKATCPCLNGGTFTGDACVCPTGYGGLYCEVEDAGGCQYYDLRAVCPRYVVDYESEKYLQ